MFHKVRAVLPFGHLKLLVWFEGGEQRLYDVSPLLAKWEPFQALEDDELFSRVAVVGGGYGIAWNDDIDLACDELFYNGAEVDVVDAGRWRVVGQASLAREGAGITQTQLERLSGVSQPVIARLERGETVPQLDTLLKILAPLGKTLEVVDLAPSSL